MTLAVAATVVAAPAAAQAPSPDREGQVPERPRLDVPVVHSLALMTLMRTAEAVIWPEPFANVDPRVWASSYERALVQRPKWDPAARAFEWDGDHWTINVIGHGIFGSELYYRPRRCGHDVLSSVVFATLASATWEYAFEANQVQPSGLDLWFTPAAGLVLGELRHRVWQAAEHIDSSFWRNAVQWTFDPFGGLERAAGSPC